MSENAAPKYPVGSLETAAAILQTLAAESHEIGMVEVAKLLGLPRSTVHRFLDTLCWLGFVDRDPVTHKYKLGLKLFELGCAVTNQMGFGRLARMYLEELVAVTGETANLGVLAGGGEVIYVDKVDSPQVLRTGIHIGFKAPLHCTALGKAFLAFLPQPEVDAVLGQHLSKRTSKSITDPEALRRELLTIRQQGFAVDDEELMTGIRCVAAPIFSRHGQVVAALSVSGPSTRLTLERLKELGPEVIERARRISQILP